MNIRKYQQKDRENLRRICIETAKGEKTETEKALLTLLYNDYFTEYEAQYTFVLADDNDEAVGYILCAPDYASYEKIFREKFLPEVKKLSRSAYLKWRLQRIPDRRVAKKYPAHLHIDILDGYTGKGEGGKLMESLLLTLKAQSVKGIFLGVGADNKKAIRFYERHGFQQLIKLFGGVYMGLAL